MHVTLLLPGALLPREVVRALAEPLAATALASLLARAQRRRRLGRARRRRTSRGSPSTCSRAQRRSPPRRMRPPPSRATRRRPTSACGTPTRCTSSSARDHVALAPLAAPPSDDDAGALIAAANAPRRRGGRRVRAHRRPLVPAHGARVGTGRAAARAAFGQPLHTVLPDGPRRRGVEPAADRDPDDAGTRIPVNEAREARGEATVNSVWLHGGGRWAPLHAPRLCDACCADEPEWRGAAQAAGIACIAPPTRRRATSALIVWSDAPRPAPAAGLDGLDRRAARPRHAPRRRSPVRARSTSS